MKRIALATLAVAAVAATVAARRNPDEFAQARQAVARAVEQAADGVAANPAPAALGLGTLLLTVALRAGRPKPAAPVPAADAEPAVLRRAKARAARAQLIADQIGLENRQRKLPEAVRNAERELCYAEKAVADANRTLADKAAAHDAAAAKLETLLAEQATADAETAAIAAELRKLADVT